MIIDYIFIGALIVFFVIGFTKGLISQIFKLVYFVVCLFGTLLLHEPLGSFVFDQGWLPISGEGEAAITAAQNNANMLGFILALIICIAVCFIAKKVVTKIFGEGKIGILNKILGGIFSAAVIWCLFGALYSVVGTTIDAINAFASGTIEEINGIFGALAELLQTDLPSTEYVELTSFMSTELLDKCFGVFNPLGDAVVNLLGGAVPTP